MPPTIKQNISLKEFSSWKVGGEAEYFCQPKEFEEIKEANEWAFKNEIPITVLSGGTNVLISDEGIPGLVILMTEFNKIENVEEHTSHILIHAQAGARKSELVKVFLKRKLAPALFLTGLPGDVGGGVVMNAGVGEMIEPREFCEITDWIEVLKPNGEVKRISAQDLEWVYRHSSGWQPGIITRAGMMWPLKTDEEVMKKVKEATKRRLERQPLQEASCGSTFRNPEGGKSGQLIESCGLKGFKVGGAKVSEKHANFIVTDDSAKAMDVHNVIEKVKETVAKKTGFNLKPEVVYLGNW